MRNVNCNIIHEI